MADPVSIAAIGMGVSAVVGGVGIASTAAGAATQAVGAAYTGNANAAMYNYQAGVARANATLAQQDAVYAEQAGEVNAQEIGLKGRAQVADTRAGIAAGNIDLNSPSARNVVRSETAITQQEESVARANAAKTAYGFETTTAMDTAQAGAYDVSAKTSRTAGALGVASSILGGVGSVSTKWLQGQSQGLWGGSSSGNYDPNAFTTSGLYVGSSQFS